MKRIGGRKFTIALTVVLLTTLLVLLSKITDTVYATVILGTAGAYITGNVYQHTQGKSDEISKTT